MHRRNLFGSFTWRRLGVQASLLAGVGLAFLGASEQPEAAEPGDCPLQDLCSFKKPVFNLIVDYSTSMNNEFGDPMDNVTRWQAAANTVKNLMTADSGFVSENMLVGLMRFGHDPDPNNPGTTIPNDASGIVDGQAVDVLWWDENDNDEYVECNGDAIIDVVNNTPAPINGDLIGIGTWTRGAIERSKQLMEQSLAAHPDDAPSLDNRRYMQLVLTDGEWTNPNGTGQSPEHNPAPLAADIHDNGIGQPGDETSVATYVVYFGELNGTGEAAANELASAGGTGAALTAQDQNSLFAAVQEVIAQIEDEVVIPSCIGGLPRVMILLDASSSMLNINGGTEPAPKGESGWDQARFALAGDDSIFDADLLDDNMMPTGDKVEDLVYLGLTVFGHNSPAPGEQRVLVNYGPCMKDNFFWALSPEVSHPGCPDLDYSPLIDAPATPMDQIIPADFCDLPWDGSPINWAFPSTMGGLPDPVSDPDGPGFDLDTHAHMPRCDSPGQNTQICSGSGTYTHLGLQLVKDNQVAYHQNALMLEEADDSTQYLNILITDGNYQGYSTDPQVQTELEQMVQSGIVTYVIGLGDGVDPVQLQKMATWGGSGAPFDANNQNELEMALQSIIESVSFDPCCQFNDCSKFPEPDGLEDDVDPGCEDDDDCDPPLVCVKPPQTPFGTCEEACACSEDADCGAMEVCNSCECEAVDCVSDSDCDQDALPPEICVDGSCVVSDCVNDSQCAEGSVCVDGECVIGACPDVPCPEGEVCVDGNCVLPGCPDVPCAADEECVDGVCTPIEPTTDPSTSTGPDPTGTTDDSTTVGPEETTGVDTDDTDTTTVDQDPDPGCDCAADEGRGRTGGLLGVLLLGLAGLGRRRRRVR